MALNLNNKVTLISAFGAAILSALLFIAIREWYSPDIRFEEGSFYILDKNAITYLKIVNYGHSDAEDVIINVKFINKINNIFINDKSLTINYLSGGVGSKDNIIKVDRIVPGYELFIYFSIDSSAEFNNSSKKYISDIMFKGGRGKTGKPIWIPILFFTIGFIISGTIGIFVGFLTARRVITKVKKIMKTQFTTQLGCLVNIIYKIDKEKFSPELDRLLEKIRKDDSIELEKNWDELCNFCKLLDSKKEQ
jgi:hypothetical protein